MRLGKEDKEVLVFSGFLVVTVFLLISIFSINQRGKSIVESPRLLPMIVVGCMFLICGVGLTRSLRAHGRPTLAKIGGSLRACAADPPGAPDFVIHVDCGCVCVCRHSVYRVLSEQLSADLRYNAVLCTQHQTCLRRFGQPGANGAFIPHFFCRV